MRVPRPSGPEQLYAIFKYLTVSPVPNTPKPSLFDFAGKAKWDAWKSAGETYKDRARDAEARYLEIARSLGWAEGAEPEERRPKAGAEESGEGGEEDIWDKEEDAERWQKGNESAMGRITSTMVVEDEGSESTLSNLAVAGNAGELVRYLQAHPEVDVNARDENVSVSRMTGCCVYPGLKTVLAGIYPAAPCC